MWIDIIKIQMGNKPDMKKSKKTGWFVMWRYNKKFKEERFC